ncbi:MAG TPA: hypothetical protein VML91_12560 [Burkholderiales bacterium]|nr:hypothetical protein [Burkholderiales bacterium]
MRRLNVTDLGALRDELAESAVAAKLDGDRFNQAARLAWLGHAVLSPVDADAPGPWLLYLERPERLAEQCLGFDEDLLRQIHILEAEQGVALAAIAVEGAKDRSSTLAALDRRDFHAERLAGR